jgi:hypothetical protein
VRRSTATTLSITSSDVTIEGFTILADSPESTTAIEVNGGSVILRENEIMSGSHPTGPFILPFPISTVGVLVDHGGSAILTRNSLTVDETSTTYRRLSTIIHEGNAVFTNNRISSLSIQISAGGSARFDHNDIQSNISVEGGRIILNDNVITSSHGNYSPEVSKGGHGELSGNTIYGSISVRDAGSRMTLTSNTIYGGIGVSETTMTLDSNTIRNKDGPCGIGVGRNGEANLTNNTIFGRECALLLWPTPWIVPVGISTAYISNNHFDSGTSGIPTIECRGETAVITSDGTNTLLDPTHTISCNNLPSMPGSNPF